LNILLLSPFYFPDIISTGKYNTYLSRSLLDFDHTIQVVTSHPFYPEWKPRYSSQQLDKITIYRAGLHVHYPSSIWLRRIVFETWFAYHAFYNFLKLRKNVDCIISVFPPSLFHCIISFFLSRRHKSIGIVHDLQGVYAARSKSLLSALIAKAIHVVEKRAFNSCDKLICLSQQMASEAISVYSLDPSRIAIHYPFVTHDFSVKPESYLSGMFSDDYIHVVYAGALGDKQNPHVLFDFFCAAQRQIPTACFHIFSSGPIYENLKRKAAFVQPQRVLFHDLVPEDHIVELYQRSDIQVIPQAPGTSSGSLPSKLPNILASGAAVFAICDESSEVANIIQDAGTGISVTTWDINILVQELSQLIDLIHGQSHELRRQNVSSLINSRFSLDRLVQDIINT